MRIEQVMTRDVRTCSPADTLSRAAELMWQTDCGCVPVLDDERRVVGLVTDRDLAMAAYLQGRRLDEIDVASVMSRDVATCSHRDPPEAAELKMQERRVRRLPVIDDAGTLVGIVSLADLVYCMMHRQTFGADGMNWVEIGRTLASVSEPRQRTP